MTNPQYLLRFDDICPTMNWRVWAEIEALLVERRLKPILAVVPDNRDPDLQVDSPVGDFWDRVRTWQEWGWTIAMHGYQHLYVSRNAGLAARRKRSEFAGLPPETQRDKLSRGMEILAGEGITSRVWIAPSDTFDATTVALLPEFGINVISAGWFQHPYVTPHTEPDGRKLFRKDSRVEFEKMTWIPLQMHYFRPAPPGVWTVCSHHNQWNGSRAARFREDVNRYGADIVSLDDVLEENALRESKWSAWLCTHPRLSEFLIRGGLKLWAMTRARHPSRASRHSSLVTRHLF
jgi:predicted deacetylase